jgi:tetratricopeptide (TPR) repeat protein
MNTARKSLRNVLASLLLALALPVLADKRNEEIDYLAVAETLLRDGAVDRAASALKNVDPAAEGVDLVKFHTVSGLIAMAENRLDDAAARLEQALGAGQTEPLVVLYLAQAYFSSEKWQQTIATLERGGEGVSALTSAWSMRAHAHWMLGQREAALDTLTDAANRFPANTTFTRRQIFYLIEAGLYQESSRVARVFLTRADVKPDDYAAIGGALRRAKSFDEALPLLETARLRYPDNLNIAKTLAQTWLEAGNTLAAANLLDEVARIDPALLAEAAELYRRAGYPMRALTLNAQITDQKKKLKQRVGILAELRRYEQLVGMQEALLRAGLFEDEDVRYALAFAHFRGGDFAGAEQHLAAIRRPELFRKATELRKIMNECADERWTCV